MSKTIKNNIDKNRVISHRGDNKNHPENTFAAVEAALLAGAKYIEFDIQMNADKSIILFHDEDFTRMSGKDLPVFETTNKNLETISIHEPEQFSNEHNPTYITYIDEVLTLLENYPSVIFLVEVKVASLRHWGVITVMEKLLTSLRLHSLNIIIISYSLKALQYVRKHSDIKIGLVFNQYLEKHKEIANNLNPDYMLCPYPIFPEAGAWKGPWEWMVYTINNLKQAEEWLAKDDISFIETDDINLVLGNN